MNTPSREAQYFCHGMFPAALRETPSCRVSSTRHNINRQNPAHYGVAVVPQFRGVEKAELARHKLHDQRDQYAHEAAYQRAAADLVDAIQGCIS